MRTDRLGRHYNPHKQSPVTKAYNSEASRVEPVVLDRFGNVGGGKCQYGDASESYTLPIYNN
jgi:hypothetical protein